MSKKYEFPKSMHNVNSHYCGGCGHGIVHKLICQIIDEMDIQQDVLLVAPVGCAVYAYNYIDVDTCEAAHGRAPAVATGTTETIHAANRGENITVIFINNAIYGMTGGQMAPTSLVGQVTKTTPNGRNADEVGYPIRACELLNTLVEPKYIERCAVYDVQHINKTKAAIKKALTYQKEGKGYSFVEVLSMCPTNWGVNATVAADWVKEQMEPYYPLGVFRDVPAGNIPEAAKPVAGVVTK